MYLIFINTHVKMLRVLFIVVFVINYDCLCYTVCGKCGCKQETDDVINLPLFTVDCSRRVFKFSPSKDSIPLSIGKLDLSHNIIEQLNETTAIYSTTLRYLDYSYNRIKIITDSYFQNLGNLSYLNLEHNYMKLLNPGIFHGIKKLKQLNLADNYIKTLPDNLFINLLELEELNLNHNDLGVFFYNIALRFLPKTLTTLYLDGIHLRNISKTTFSGLKNLKKITVVDNPINELFPVSFQDLEYLDISGTNISVLRMKYNSLKVLIMKRLQHLTKIDNFNSFPNLEELVIEDCKQFRDLDSLAFGRYINLTNFHLKKISLAGNNLQFLSENFEYIFNKIEFLDLEKNPWHCGCGISWMANLKNIRKPYNTRCHSPASFRNKIITSLQSEDFCFDKKEENDYMLPSPHTLLYPLIGVLSIIVLILVGVLVYMGPFGSYSMRWNRSIGPESPYNRMTIVDNYEESSRHL